MIEELHAWREQSACYGVDDPDIFFEAEDNRRDYPGEARAKAICATCPVRENCLDWAINTDERWGILGGMTFMERRKVLRRRRKYADLTDRLFDHIVEGFLDGIGVQMYGV